MMYFRGFILICLASLVACDVACYREKTEKCQKEWREKHQEEMNSFCPTAPNMTACMVRSASQCQTGLADEAAQALLVQVLICNPLHEYNKAVMEDRNCSFDTLIASRTCDMQKEGGLCKNLDSSRQCVNQIFSKCSKDTQKAFYDVYDTFINLMRRHCAYIGARSCF